MFNVDQIIERQSKNIFPNPYLPLNWGESNNMYIKGKAWLREKGGLCL